MELFRVVGPLSLTISATNDYHVGLVREGIGTAWLPGGGCQHRFCAGHLGIFPPGQDHGASSQGPVEVVSIYLKPSLIAQASAEMDPANVEIEPQVSLTDLTLHRRALALEAELRSGLPANRLFGESIGAAIAAHLLGRYGKKPMAQAYRGGMPKYLLRRTIDHMQSNLGADLRLSELAANVQMSPWHFCRTFKQSTGLSPHKYLMRERIEAAKQLLARPHRNLEEIATQLGFTDQSHFITVFHRIAGYTPGQFINGLR